MAKKKEPNKWADRIKELGFDDITSFYRAKKPKMSGETVRRAISEGRGNLNPVVVVKLMQAMDYTPDQIGEELKKRGDTSIYKLIGQATKGTVLNDRETKIVNAMRAEQDLYDIYIAIAKLVKANG